jgi:hypothetical protein
MAGTDILVGAGTDRNVCSTHQITRDEALAWPRVNGSKSNDAADGASAKRRPNASIRNENLVGYRSIVMPVSRVSIE